MNYIANSLDVAALYKGLNDLALIALNGMEADHAAYCRACAAINSLRTRIGQFAKISPYLNPDGEEVELIDASFMAECDTHGVFFIDGGRPVKDEECPECILDRTAPRAGAMSEDELMEAQYEENRRPLSLDKGLPPGVQMMKAAFDLIDNAIERERAKREGAAG